MSCHCVSVAISIATVICSAGIISGSVNLMCGPGDLLREGKVHELAGERAAGILLPLVEDNLPIDFEDWTGLDWTGLDWTGLD